MPEKPKKFEVVNFLWQKDNQSSELINVYRTVNNKGLITTAVEKP